MYGNDISMHENENFDLEMFMGNLAVLYFMHEILRSRFSSRDMTGNVAINKSSESKFNHLSYKIWLLCYWEA